MRILVAGSPGTGKTTMSERLAEELGCDHVDVSALIRASKTYDRYNDELDTYEFDARKARRMLKKHLQDKCDFIVDTHSVDVARGIKFDRIFVLRTTSDVLYQRLLTRGYPPKKIRENIECEIFGVVHEDCTDLFPRQEITVIHNDEETSWDVAMSKIKGESMCYFFLCILFLF